MKQKSNSLSKFTTDQLIQELENRGQVFVGGVLSKNKITKMCNHRILMNLDDEVIDPTVRRVILKDVLKRVQEESQDSIPRLFEKFYFDEDLRLTKYNVGKKEFC